MENTSWNLKLICKRVYIYRIVWNGIVSSAICSNTTLFLSSVFQLWSFFYAIAECGGDTEGWSAIGLQQYRNGHAVDRKQIYLTPQSVSMFFLPSLLNFLEFQVFSYRVIDPTLRNILSVFRYPAATRKTNTNSPDSKRSHTNIKLLPTSFRMFPTTAILCTCMNAINKQINK